MRRLLVFALASTLLACSKDDDKPRRHRHDDDDDDHPHAYQLDGGAPSSGDKPISVDGLLCKVGLCGGDDPDAVCHHALDMMWGLYADAGLPMDAKLMDECKKSLEKLRAKDASGYACMTRCVMGASDFTAMEKCDKGCGVKL